MHTYNHIHIHSHTCIRELYIHIQTSTHNMCRETKEWMSALIIVSSAARGCARTSASVMCL